MVYHLLGFVGVYMAGHILEATKSWSAVFNQTAGVCMFGWLVYMIFGTGKQIVWDEAAIMFTYTTKSLKSLGHINMWFVFIMQCKKVRVRKEKEGKFSAVLISFLYNCDKLIMLKNSCLILLRDLWFLWECVLVMHVIQTYMYLLTLFFFKKTIFLET